MGTSVSGARAAPKLDYYFHPYIQYTKQMGATTLQSIEAVLFYCMRFKFKFV